MTAYQLRFLGQDFLELDDRQIPAVLSAVQQRLVVFFDRLVDRIQP